MHFLSLKQDPSVTAILHEDPLGMMKWDMKYTAVMERHGTAWGRGSRNETLPRPLPAETLEDTSRGLEDFDHNKLG